MTEHYCVFAIFIVLCGQEIAMPTFVWTHGSELGEIEDTLRDAGITFTSVTFRVNEWGGVDRPIAVRLKDVGDQERARTALRCAGIVPPLFPHIDVLGPDDAQP